MKTVVKCFLVSLVLVLLLLAGAYLLLTHPGFQKRMIESRLPEGSSIGTVRLGLGRAQLSDLDLHLADGTQIRVGSLETDYRPLAAVFEKIVRLGAVDVDDVHVSLPQSLLAGEEAVAAPGRAPSAPTSTEAEPVPERTTEPPAEEAAEDPLAPIYALARLEWLIEIESLDVEGMVDDAAGNRFDFRLGAGTIFPGEATPLEGSMKLVTEAPLRAGLVDFQAELSATLHQGETGGFTTVDAELSAEGRDDVGAALLASSQQVELNVDAAEEGLTLALDFTADVPAPEVFSPELRDLGATEVRGTIGAEVIENGAVIRAANVEARLEGERVAHLELKQALRLGGKQSLEGELLRLEFDGLQPAWLNPWLPEGTEVAAEAIDAEVSVDGEPDGGLVVRWIEPMRVAALSVTALGAPQVDGLGVRLQPMIRWSPDGTIEYKTGEAQLSDRYGGIASFSSEGVFAAVEGTEDRPFKGMDAGLRLDADLQALLLQPALAGRVGVIGGRLDARVRLDGDTALPLVAQGTVERLRTRGLPGRFGDYRFAMQLSGPAAGKWGVDGTFQAGSDGSPETDLQLSGSIEPDSDPLRFSILLEGERVAQRSLEHLASALATEAEAVRQPDVSTTGAEPRGRVQAPSPRTEARQAAPPWSGLEGELAVRLDEVILEKGPALRELSLQARVTEPELVLRSFSVAVEPGRVGGSGLLRFEPDRREPYALEAEAEFSGIDPGEFSGLGPRIPVQASFEGGADLRSRGTDLDMLLDNVQGEVEIRGSDGVLSAFELDERSRLGLLGAGILGQQLDRPGMTALAQAIPYFKDLRFETFTLKLSRGSDRNITIPQLRFVGDNLLLDARGMVAARSLDAIMDQPLDLSLELGARGRLTDYLETLNLLQPKAATGGGEDGAFRMWKQRLDVGGTLANPDTSSLRALLSEAARSVLARPGENGDAGRQSKLRNNGSDASESANGERSRREPLREDIEMGLDLLNTVLGE